MSLRHDLELGDTLEHVRGVRARQQQRREQQTRMRLAASGTNAAVLDEPWVQPILARVGAAIDPDYPDRVDHAMRITLDVVSARLRPRHPVNAKYSTASGGCSLGGSAAARGRKVSDG